MWEFLTLRAMTLKGFSKIPRERVQSLRESISDGTFKVVAEVMAEEIRNLHNLVELAEKDEVFFETSQGEKNAKNRNAGWLLIY